MLYKDLSEALEQNYLAQKILVKLNEYSSKFKMSACLSQKGVQWYVSIVSTFPNSFALVLDSNLHDLNGTNPD